MINVSLKHLDDKNKLERINYFNLIFVKKSQTHSRDTHKINEKVKNSMIYMFS